MYRQLVFVVDPFGVCKWLKKVTSSAVAGLTLRSVLLAFQDVDRVIPTAPGWRHYKIWLPTDIGGVSPVNFYPDYLSEC
ncbi:hypothetical protein T265_02808 [Opisthorchis viverrini]|uniref:Uncharacterized protein n=1 Tax=Opisthorchis viverrini TaxID=6198 RepID=A0A075AI23_OPIVI|nr:hypothetical protein T265_02808 [Opisthorchis viverrini]KER30884.1 hypothetical protein T265_02808 [Opisthorchis viverrini]